MKHVILFTAISLHHGELLYVICTN